MSSTATMSLRSAAQSGAGVESSRGGDGAALAVVVGQVAALSEKLAKLTSDFASLRQSLPAAVEASLDARMPNVVTQHDFGNLFKESSERASASFASALSELRTTVTKDIYQHTATLIEDYDKIIGERFNNVANDIASVRSVCSSPAAVAACPVGLPNGPDITRSGDIEDGLKERSNDFLDDSAGKGSPQGLNILDVIDIAVDKSCAAAAATFPCLGQVRDVEVSHIEAFAAGDFVTLHGLQTGKLNSLSATVLGFDESSGRYSIRLASSRECKKVKRVNLVEYIPNESEMCQICQENINLFAFPPCECSPATLRGVDSQSIDPNRAKSRTPYSTAEWQP